MLLGKKNSTKGYSLNPLHHLKKKSSRFKCIIYRPITDNFIGQFQLNNKVILFRTI